ncbi:hypothetical protein [Yanshouia hominis]|uniref:Uncharacterized protein n=1 Tax=Yanshouia hominis TaxID=2763673 RepID=A0ABR7NJT4_9FIRM|nr:hypothetical protein [Yanshouia hominis]MBC8576667.1 hypothetical protein [Yanshouia hominis]
MRCFLSLVLAFCLCLLPVSAGALTYAEYLADQGYSQDEIDQIISSGEDVSASDTSNSTIYIDNSQLLDSGSSVQVDSLTVQAQQVLLSAPENNDYPSGAPLAGGVYMQVTTSALGELLIYVPSNYQSKAFTFESGTKEVINITSSTITAYVVDQADYSFRWSSFGRLQYRRNSGSYSYEDVNITDILNTNIVFVESNDDLPPVPDSNMLQIIITFLLGGCLLCLFIKRL